MPLVRGKEEYDSDHNRRNKDRNQEDLDVEAAF
jgi:hypothetical protein